MLTVYHTKGRLYSLFRMPAPFVNHPDTISISIDDALQDERAGLVVLLELGRMKSTTEPVPAFSRYFWGLTHDWLGSPVMTFLSRLLRWMPTRSNRLSTAWLLKKSLLLGMKILFSPTHLEDKCLWWLFRANALVLPVTKPLSVEPGARNCPKLRSLTSSAIMFRNKRSQKLHRL